MKTKLLMSWYRIRYMYMLLFIFCNSWSQDIDEPKLDSLYQLDYDELSKAFLRINRDTLKYKKYGNAYLKKSRLLGDTIKQSNAFYLLGLMSKEFTAIRYADSIIDLTKDIRDFVYPARGYLLKARNLGRIQSYPESLNQLIKAKYYADLNDNIDQKYRIKYFIGVLKVTTGELEASLDQYKSINEYYKRKYEKDSKYRQDYLKSIFAVGNGYTRLKKTILHTIL